MKKVLCVFLGAGALAVSDASLYSQPAPVVRVAPLPPTSFSPTVSEVVKLTQSGLGDDVVIAYVKNSAARFNLTANDIVGLKNSGVSEPIISAMLTHDSAVPRPAPVFVAPQNQYSSTPPPSPIPNAPTAPPASSVPPAVTIPDAPHLNDAPLVPSPNPPLVVDQAPPAPRVEVIPVAPGSNYYWVPGYWSWNGTWVWRAGYWTVRPWHNAVWVPGHWSRHGRGYIWIRGRWS
jgi:hypothetical protein